MLTHLLVALLASASVDRSVLAMGTTLEIHLERGGTSAASEDAVREVERIEASCSTWRSTSAWSRLNKAHGASVSLSPEWISLLATAVDWQERTGGAFDPVLGALLRAWGIRSGGHTPSLEELAAARHASGAALLSLDPIHHTAQLREGAQIEEGAFVKGYALDRARTVLLQRGVDAGWLDFGGQVLAWGHPRNVQIASPSDRQRPVLSFWLSDGSLSTSGTSEHGRHIVNPLTGEPCPAWGSVSVVAPDGLTADVLSTALYVMGPTLGLAWANAHQVAAVFQPVLGAPRMSERLRTLHPVPEETNL